MTKARYLTCQLCGRRVKIREDGKLPTHKVPFSSRHFCIGSRAYP